MDRSRTVLIGAVALCLALSVAIPSRADDPLTPLNDAFLAAIREHRTRDALVLLKSGATARIRGFAAACQAGDFYVAKAYFPYYLKVTKLLYAARAFDPLQRDSKGKTAREIGRELGFSDAAQVLAKREADNAKRQKP